MFVLRIPVTLSHLNALKGGLAKVLPDVKSSHRVEALGRGLGSRPMPLCARRLNRRGH